MDTKFFLYYLSDFEEIEDSHKYKYQLTMDGKCMYSQIGGFVKKIRGELYNYTRIFFRSMQQIFVRLREECGFKMITCLHCKPSGLMATPKRGYVAKCKNVLC